MIKYEKDPLECRYASHDDIKVKLHGSWAYYKGEPVKITTGQETDYKLLHLSAIRGTRWHNFGAVSVNSPDIDQYNFRYGWFNSPDHNRAILSSRLPSRRYKQGVNSDTLSMVGYYGKGLSAVGFEATTISAMMKGEYPDFDTGMKILKESGSVALSRDVAIIKMDDEYRVFVGEDNVGKFHFETGTVEVEKPGIFSIIQSTLQEVGL